MINTRFTFELDASSKTKALPHKLLINQNETETIDHVALKLLSFLLFFRDRLKIETDVDLDHIPFTPDLVQLDYCLRPALWVECGECEVKKLKKLSVKAADAEIWIVTKHPRLAQSLLDKMSKAGLRKNRFSILAFDPEMFTECSSLIAAKNRVFWHRCSWAPAQLEFDLNEVWFDAPFSVWRF